MGLMVELAGLVGDFDEDEDEDEIIGFLSI